MGGGAHLLVGLASRRIRPQIKARACPLQSGDCHLVGWWNGVIGTEVFILAFAGKQELRRGTECHRHLGRKIVGRVPAFERWNRVEHAYELEDTE